MYVHMIHMHINLCITTYIIHIVHTVCPYMYYIKIYIVYIMLSMLQAFFLLISHYIRKKKS